jgi:hypothetical protein
MKGLLIIQFFLSVICALISATFVIVSLVVHGHLEELPFWVIMLCLTTLFLRLSIKELKND